MPSREAQGINRGPSGSDFGERQACLVGAPRVQPHEHCFDVPVQDIDPAQPVYQVRRLQDWLEESAAEPRATTTLSGVFALVALLLAAVGVCGVLSYSVARRTQEIAVRMAIGAERAQIMRLVLRGGMAWAFSGITIGLVGAFALSRVLRTLLFEVGPRDPITYSTVGVMLALVAMLACYLPAARATRIDPMIALRTE
jgi:putative ABC transport system permease protein